MRRELKRQRSRRRLIDVLGVIEWLLLTALVGAATAALATIA